MDSVNATPGADAKKQEAFQKKSKNPKKNEKKSKKKKAEYNLSKIFDNTFSKHHTKEKKAFIKKAKELGLPKNIFDNFKKASKEVRKEIFKTLDEDPILVNLIKSTPGIGKTEATLLILLHLAKIGLNAFYAASNREQVWQAFDRLKAFVAGYGQVIVNLQGRHGGYIRNRLEPDGTIVEVKVPPNCEKIDEVRKATAKGYSPHSTVCVNCHRCPTYRNKHGDKTGYKNACGYFRAKGQASGIIPVGDGTVKPIVVMTHQMAACVVTDSEIIKPDFLCIDEDFTSAMRETIAWDEDELQRIIVNIPELVRFRLLMKQAVRVAKKFRELAKYKDWNDQYKALSYEEKVLHESLTDAIIDHETVTLSGINLYHVLKMAAYEMGSEKSVEKILEKASQVDVRVGVGGFIGMSDEIYEKVPHAKEPDLALELLNVIRGAKKLEESAYKVSMRKTRESEWGFHWDYVRRISYGGRLLILDAYGDEKIYERVCNREVKTVEIKCKMRDNVTVFHSPASTSRKYMDNEKNRLRLYYEHLVPILQKSKGKKVIIYTQKRYAEWLLDMIEKSDFELGTLSIKWFWMDHGDNNYGDFDKLVVFGSAFSNVIADMHLVNAVYAGDKTIDFSKLKNGEYADDRVASVKKSRQENEMMQALFRLRPSKPRKEPQDIHIISKMKLPLDYEMPGAAKKMYYKPDFDKENFVHSMRHLYKHFGFYVHSMAPFIYEKSLLIDWYDAGATASDKSLLSTYEEFRNRYDLFNNSQIYKRIIASSKFMFDADIKTINFHDKYLKVWGDEKKARKFLEELKLEFREPGCDDGDPPVQQQTPVEPENNAEPDEEQVAEESKPVNDPNELFKVLKSVKFMSDQEFDEKYAAYGKELSPSGTDTS